jgi:nucleoside triphosphate pyrophosphatase
MAAAQPMPSPRHAPLILASASPRRLDLLRQIGIEPQAVSPAHIDETPRKRELPAPYARRMAGEKAAAAAPAHPGAFILAADTAVAVGRRLLPKVEDAAAARRCLELLSGRRHRVFGGLVVIAPDGRRVARLVTTIVWVKRLHPTEIDDFIAAGEWQGKAGGYAIQGRAAAFIPRIGGSYSNVVGLPLAETAAALVGLGYRAGLGYRPADPQE